MNHNDPLADCLILTSFSIDLTIDKITIDASKQISILLSLFAINTGLLAGTPKITVQITSKFSCKTKREKYRYIYIYLNT